MTEKSCFGCGEEIKAGGTWATGLGNDRDIYCSRCWSAKFFPNQSLSQPSPSKAVIKLEAFVGDDEIQDAPPPGTFSHDRLAFRVRNRAAPTGVFAEIFSFQGRIDRFTFWLYAFVLGFLNMIVLVSLSAAGGWSLRQAGVGGAPLGILIIGFWFLLLAWASLAILVKRWHDLGVTGWAVLVNLIPIINILVVVIVLGLMPGEPGPNKYGEKPK